MNFLIDAQLPRKMTAWLSRAGCHGIHTFDLPNGSNTTDDVIIETADCEQRILVTKDADFVDTHLLRNQPAKLLLVSTGNINNRELEDLVAATIPDIIREFANNSFLELGRGGILVRG